MLLSELYEQLFLVEQQLLKVNQQYISSDEIDALKKMHDDLRFQIHKVKHQY